VCIGATACAVNAVVPQGCLWTKGDDGFCGNAVSSCMAWHLCRSVITLCADWQCLLHRQCGVFLTVCCHISETGRVVLLAAQASASIVFPCPVLVLASEALCFGSPTGTPPAGMAMSAAWITMCVQVEGFRQGCWCRGRRTAAKCAA
jgi:hypothetical protein